MGVKILAKQLRIFRIVLVYSSRKARADVALV